MAYLSTRDRPVHRLLCRSTNIHPNAKPLHLDIITMKRSHLIRPQLILMTRLDQGTCIRPHIIGKQEKDLNSRVWIISPSTRVLSLARTSGTFTHGATHALQLSIRYFLVWCVPMSLSLVHARLSQSKPKMRPPMQTACRLR